MLMYALSTSVVPFLSLLTSVYIGFHCAMSVHPVVESIQLIRLSVSLSAPFDVHK